MRFLAILVLLFLGCGKKPPPPVAEVLPFLELGDFEHRERMELPPRVRSWDRKLVRATGYVNPMNETRNLRKFLLVKDRAGCCFGRAPQINHFIDVSLRDGEAVHYTTDPMTVEGTLEVGEVWDGDWLIALYVMKDARRVQ